MTTAPDPDSEYCLRSVSVPVVRGRKLKLLAGLLRTPLRPLVTGVLAGKFGIPGFRKLRIGDTPLLLPVHHVPGPAAAGERICQEKWPGQSVRPASGFQFPGAHGYARAYREGRTTPEEAAQRFLDALAACDASDPPLRAFASVNRDDVMRQARESAHRIREGKTLSILDGVPVAVKDEVAMVPYATGAGTRFLGRDPETEDATIVARLRAAGALLLGKTAMHEIGLGVTGLNVLQGTPRNPFAPGHYCGGSSSGSAAAVASGLCPLATGGDGGGSIRIPAAFCGIVGLKPTFGRLSSHGAIPLCWSVGHPGLMAASAGDVALGYAVMAGPDAEDIQSLHQPAPSLDGWDHMDLTGMKIGVYAPWFRHAQGEIVTSCEELLRRFERSGAVVREITMPDLEAARLAHAVTIASEMAHCVDHIHGGRRQRFNLDVQVALAVARTFGSSDYIRAQQVRARLMAHFQRAFESVDVIVTPATAVTAPAISKAAAEIGESDLGMATEIMRFATPPNLTGHPAISFPAGYSRNGLPIGMQAIGRPWDEVTLFRLALMAEQAVERRKPQIFHHLLSRP